MTGTEAGQIRDVLRRYDRAVAACDACAVADLYAAYGAHFPGPHPEAFGADIEERYLWLFDFDTPAAGHELSELVHDDGLTFAVTTSDPAGTRPDLFVFTESAGQWKILASITSVNPTVSSCGDTTDGPSFDIAALFRDAGNRIGTTTETLVGPRPA